MSIEKAPHPVSLDRIRQAAERIQSHIHRTQVLTCSAVDDWVGTQVFFKCENFQKAGAFKFRGATNAILQLSDEERKRGVVTHSSGNHAGALALAAKTFGVDAYVVMPSNSTAIKKAAVNSYGGKITECEPTLQARLEVSARVQQETGAIMIPPFDHEHIIEGQGTCAIELMEQVEQLEAIIAPVGGGGLISGTCIAAKSLDPKIIVWGGEPEGADDAYQSKTAGEMIPQLKPDTISDGLRTSLGTLTWPIVRDLLDEVITVTDEETVVAMRFFWERAKVVIEPSSAVPLAALKKRLQGDAAKPAKVGLIISGGNVDLANLPWQCLSCPNSSRG